MLDSDEIRLAAFMTDVLTLSANTSLTLSDLSIAMLPGRNVSAIMANVASSLTTVLRTGSNSTVAKGIVWQEQTVIHIQYEWLVLPIVLVLSSVVLLASAAMNRSRAPLWKSSSYPLLYHGIQNWNDSEAKALADGHLESNREMEASAKTVDVQLCRGPGIQGTFFSSSLDDTDELHTEF